MCLIKLTLEREQTELAKLPDIFSCWKVIYKDGRCYYDRYGKQPKLTRGTHTAQDFPAHRGVLQYASSFHAYLKMPILKKWDVRRYRVVKCWAKKEDINRIGYSQCDYKEILAVAVSKITRK